MIRIILHWLASIAIVEKPIYCQCQIRILVWTYRCSILATMYGVNISSGQKIVFM